MRKVTLLFVSLLLVGCGLMATPTPSPTSRPTATPTPTQTPKYYPTADPQTAQELRYRLQEPGGYYHEVTAPDGLQFKYFSLLVISSGEIGTLQIGNFALDILWVYERNRIVAKYPLVLGVQEGNTYVPYYVGYSGTPERQTYLDYLQQHGILERGRKIFPSISGSYVSRKGIEWQSCGKDVFCRLGRYMQDTYSQDYKVINRVMGWEVIPEGWALAWMWDAATDANSIPEAQKIDLP